MPNNAATDVAKIEELEDDDDDFSKDDFGFVIGPDGELKSIVYPEHLMSEPPEEIKLILEIFGIENLEALEHRTLH